MDGMQQPMNFNDLFMAQNLGMAQPPPMSGAQSPYPSMIGAQPPMAGPQNIQLPPEINHLANVVQQYTQNKQQQQNTSGLVQDILANRMQPELQDASKSVFLSNQNGPGGYVSPDQVMAERYKNQLSPYTEGLGLANQNAELSGKLMQNNISSQVGLPAAMAALQKEQAAGKYADPMAQADLELKQAHAKYFASGGGSGAGGGGATGALVNRLMAEDPSMSFEQALYLVQTGFRQGMGIGTNGMVTPMQGAAESKGALKLGEKSGEQQAVLNYAAPIEQQKKIGQGEITDIQKKELGQQGVSQTVSSLEGLYDQLDKAGAAVSTTNTLPQNLSANIRGSTAGQMIGRVAGTPEQSIRNQISMQIPNLINDIRQATGMSAKAMDSNAELQFYLKMATDPHADIQANKAALGVIKNKYLSGFQSQTAPTGSATHRYNPVNGQLEGAQ